jgi:hypothetical protein
MRSRRCAEGKYLSLPRMEPWSSNPQPVNYKLIIIAHHILRQREYTSLDLLRCGRIRFLVCICVAW